MATFQIHYRQPDEADASLIVKARSFPDALTKARASLPTVRFIRVRMLDAKSTITLRCDSCGQIASIEVQWTEAPDVIVPCPNLGCTKRLRLRRERTVVAQHTPLRTTMSDSQVFGKPPVESAEHALPPTTKDRLKAKVRSRDVVKWRCRNCRWTLECDWNERMDAHTCPRAGCGCKQYIPANTFAWNARLIHEWEAQQAAAESTRRAKEAAEQRRRENKVRHQREAAQAAERQRQAELHITLNRLAEIAVGAGLIQDEEVFHRLNADDIRAIKTHSDLADALQTDLIAAMDDNVRAEKGVAYGRPAAAGASVLALLNGYGWAGLAFGVLAAGARVISDDWKRAKVAEYQAKWTRTFSQFSVEQMAVFTRVFAYKYPMLASMAAGMHGQLAAGN